MKNVWWPRLASVGLSLTLLSGCGGGGSDAGTKPEPLTEGFTVAADTSAQKLDGVYPLKVSPQVFINKQLFLGTDPHTQAPNIETTPTQEAIGTDTYGASNLHESTPAAVLLLYASYDTASKKVTRVVLIRLNNSAKIGRALACGALVGTTCNVTFNTDTSEVQIQKSTFYEVDLATGLKATPGSSVQVSGILKP